MKRALRQQLESYLQQCREAIETMGIPVEPKVELRSGEKSTKYDYEGIQHAWEHFLVMHARFFTKLEQGSKENDSTRKWFKAVKQSRKSDPVLIYLQHARNSDEHSISISSHLGPMVFKGAMPPEVTAFPDSDDYDGKWDIYSESGGVIDFGALLPKAVKDRGVSYEPPTNYSGINLQSASVKTMAEQGLLLIEAVFQESQEKI